MIRWHRTAGALALLIALSCGSPSEGMGRGVVQGIDVEARRVTLDHGDIPGLMKAMTMTFEVAPEVSLEGLALGETVEFTVREAEDSYLVTAIDPAGS